MKTAEQFLKEKGLITKEGKLGMFQTEYDAALLSQVLIEYSNQSKWISVEDRLPEVNTESFGQNYSVPVLGITEDGDIVQTSVEYSTSEWLGTNFYITITHWQPLPTAP